MQDFSPGLVKFVTSLSRPIHLNDLANKVSAAFNMAQAV